ncbi:MAG: pyruvate dehydrogenase complex dihydrolipoamide acetyltransferase [Micavibrio aeruginosavorus]|uniref:Acetyltransferase component of pyruvate dehydrogenase complex n=1 Tax=Micavibrio aeruginosavorus TaxID=349221 RepID=A0A2W5FK87_9BACT|nr:MAG: pyruvate dehydrogenase complex dihydrolipoamide acetyltransferase [Micavibrio aeruginosavorus]
MPINILMPALSPTMTEGTLAKWLKKSGDKVKAGDVIAEIETDKATMEVEAVDEGTIGKILVEAGTANVAVNTPIAVLLEEGEDASAADKAPAPAAAPKAEAKKEEAPKAAEPTKTPAPAAAPSHGNRVFATPLARRIADQKGLDLTSVKGSGPHGRIVKHDVENAKAGAAPAASQKSTAAPSADAKTLSNAYGMKYTEIPNNNIKNIVAKRLLESKTTVPHFYLSIDCNLTNLMAARAELNKQGKDAYKLSVNDFVIKASAMALKAYPAANVSWTDDAVLQYESSDISVAVATPNGLITPIIKAAETKGLKDISNEMKDLAKRARDGKLKPEEFQGGTFSVSNLGMFGITNFQAIINPPQACILAVGAGIEKPVVINGKLEIATVMTVTLSVDHRCVDGAVGAEYLQIFKNYIENPVSMLV